MNDGNIFATPSPVGQIRLESSFSVTFEFRQNLDDIFAALEYQNRKEMSSPVPIGKYATPEAASLIFSLCNMMSLSHDTKYLTLEIYERFMNIEMDKMYSKIKKWPPQDISQWSQVHESIMNKSLLKLLTCLQIASKIHIHTKALTIKDVQKVLHKAGINCSSRTVLLSELKVLDTLNFEISSSSSLVYIEILLVKLSINISLKMYDQLYKIAIQMLDLVHLHHVTIYTKLLQVVLGHGKCDVSDSILEKFAPVQSDKVLLASSVLIASSYLLDEHLSEVILHSLSTITKIRKDDLSDFAAVLVQHVQE